MLKKLRACRATEEKLKVKRRLKEERVLKRKRERKMIAVA